MLYGYSQGARLALGAVLLGGAAARPPGAREWHGRPQAAAGARPAQGRRRGLAQQLERDGVEAFIREWEARPLFAGLSRLPPAAREALAARRRDHRPEGLAAALRGLGLGAQPSLWAQLPRLSVPVLCLSGARDAKFTLLMSQVAAAAPRGRHLELDAGHAPHLECSERLARELIDFSTHPFPARADRAEEAA